MPEAQQVEISGIRLDCKHCGNDTFLQKEGLVNSRGMTLMGFDWLDAGAIVHICSSCGFLHWFSGTKRKK